MKKIVLMVAVAMISLAVSAQDVARFLGVRGGGPVVRHGVGDADLFGVILHFFKGPAFHYGSQVTARYTGFEGT